MTATIKTLAKFDSTIGEFPSNNLIIDSSGDVFGTTSKGGAYGEGTVFEIVKTATGYAANPVILVNFYGATGGGLTIDSSGNLFGTATGTDGSIFEIAKTATGYASTPTTLANFNGTDGNNPATALTIDANGDLFGTTEQGGANHEGTVFELTKTATGYASAPTALVSFPNTHTAGNDASNLYIDHNGNLFDTLGQTVIEIAKTATGYASSITTVASFAGTDAGYLFGTVVADSQGNLYGTTDEGGEYGDGTMYEIVKTATGYVSTPTILINFDGTNGAHPQGSLIVDAKGDLFGTTETGGTHDKGTAFELKKTATGYASTVTTLVTFGNDNGKDPGGSLLANANGNLFGTTQEGGGQHNDGYTYGTLFEITGSGFATGAAAATADVVSPLAGGSNAPAMTFLAPASTDQSETTPPANGWHFFAELQTSQLLAPASLTSTETASAGPTDDSPATGFSASLHLFDTSASHLLGAIFKGN
jgi:uncharacterized repeat protein (TIGR03803 family)